MAADAVRQVMLKGGMFMLPPTPDRAHPYGRPPPDAAHDARPKWLDRLRPALRSPHYTRRTEQTYCHWVKRFIDFHHVRHPAEKGMVRCGQAIALSA